MSAGYPRYGVPSASSLHRIIACPYSHKAEQGMPEDETEDSKTGDRIHAWLANQPVELSTQELRTAEMCREAEDRLIDEWSTAKALFIIRERRLGLMNMGRVIDIEPETSTKPIFTGQPDVVYVDGGRVFVIDYKTLSGEVEPAVDNPQLMALAVLTALRHRVSDVTVAIVQPLAGKPTIANFHSGHLEIAAGWLFYALENERKATPADTKAGSHCLYCKAKLNCKTWLAEQDNRLEVMQPMLNCSKDSQSMWASMSEQAGRISDAELIARYRGLKMARVYPEVIIAEMKRRAESPDFPFAMTQAEAGAREITGEPQAVMNAVAKLGVTQEAFVQCLKGVSVTELQEAVRKASGVISKEGAKVTKYALSHKDAGEAMKAALGDLMSNRVAPVELTEKQKEIE